MSEPMATLPGNDDDYRQFLRDKHAHYSAAIGRAYEERRMREREYLDAKARFKIADARWHGTIEMAKEVAHQLEALALQP